MPKQTAASAAAAAAASLGLSTAAPAASSPSNPAAIGNTSLKMLGLAGAFTAAGSGLVVVIVTGVAATATAAQAMTVGGRYGTGSAPANAAAVTGTRFGGAADQTIGPAAAAAAGIPFTIAGLVQLAVGQAYWFDVALSTASASDAASVTSPNLTFIEFPQA